MAVRISKRPTKDGKKYYFDTYYRDGGVNKRYRSKLYATKSEARKAEGRFLDNTEALLAVDYTFGQMADIYVQNKGKNWKASTQAKNAVILNHIRAGLGKIPITKLTVGQYEAFLSYLDNLYRIRQQGGKRLKTPYSARYKNRVVMCLKSICNYAEIHYGIRTRIPFQYDYWKESKNRKINLLTERQFDLFISKVDEPTFRAFFTFLMYTGCRRGEALALQFSDVDFEGRRVSIDKSFSKVEMTATATKTPSSIRTIPLADKAFQACVQMRELHAGDYVFGGKAPLAFSTIERKKSKALRLAGLPEMRVHDFRHSFITMMVSKGADIATVSHYVGHASIKQTLDTYTHYYEDKMEELIRAL